ncbi:Predicted arabinose efflux permease, MFS family [Ferrithrix thermotolerans DSM 19514]|uniref:Predicted arabinose efflux permease, MFS family n=1 Tax=Ferrithrix thermotolerans DSM 19514 TaxID=1121881 RepID=A0A1M4XI47_9ACTN|nr:YbfB/YjiJ family MFS transporter [Ferrithrix thermotolerans]SHE92832.1 Predicted arabinose efflux permease, MFS family [Ferrithrix thermotolerans DSM 19514]
MKGRSHEDYTAVYDRYVDILSRRPTSNLTVAILMAWAPATAIGFARFSYALLLPPMAQPLHLNYEEAGALNVTNAMGYLVGALSVHLVAKRYGHKRTVLMSMLMLVLLLLFVGGTNSYTLILFLRGLSGYFGALVFIAGGAVLAHYLSGKKASAKEASLALGLYFGGAGLGTAISGAVLPALLSFTGEGRWQYGWFALAVLSFMSLLLVQRGVSHISEHDLRDNDRESDIELPKARVSTLWAAILSYGIFGAGHISFMTFVVVLLKLERKTSLFISIFYVVLGGSSLLSAYIWSGPLSRLKGGFGLGATYIVVAAGSALPTFTRSNAGALPSALLFGLGLMASSTAFAKTAERNLPLLP